MEMSFIEMFNSWDIQGFFLFVCLSSEPSLLPNLWRQEMSISTRVTVHFSICILSRNSLCHETWSANHGQYSNFQPAQNIKEMFLIRCTNISPTFILITPIKRNNQKCNFQFIAMFLWDITNFENCRFCQNLII